jgi:hypothetical protein
MFPTTQTTYQVISIFGGNYIAEQHADATQRCFPGSDGRERAVDFERLLAALRSALSLRRHRHVVAATITAGK